MSAAPSLLQNLLGYRADVFVLLAIAAMASLGARKFLIDRGAGTELSARIWLVTLGPVASGALLTEWMSTAQPASSYSDAIGTFLGRFALLGAFGAAGALLLLDAVHVAILRAELRANEESNRRHRQQQESPPVVARPRQVPKTRREVTSRVRQPSLVSPIPRILVVDDMETNRCLLELYLRQNGFEPELASGGHEAVRLATARHYDAILMDLQMPDLDGLAATREIRSRETAGRRTPIIALTASTAQGTRELCLAAGMDEHFTKPIDLPQFKLLLAEFTSREAGSTVAFRMRRPGSAPSSVSDPGNGVTAP